MLDSIWKINLANPANLCPKLTNLLTTSTDHLAYVIDQNQIEIINYTSKNSFSLKKCHEEKVTCLRFSNNTSYQPYLCSCSIDQVLIWNLNKLTQSAKNQAKVIKSMLEFEPKLCIFHPDNQKIAVCYGDMITIVQIEVCF